MKLSLAQRLVLERLRDGWGLGQSGGLLTGGGIWQQEGGLGRGGRAVTVSVSTFQALYRGKMIVKLSDLGGPGLASTWGLTDAGRAALGRGGG